MPEKASEKSNMSSVEFVRDALRENVAPANLGSAKTRQRQALRILQSHERKTSDRKRRRHWSANRVRDFWNGSERVTPNADEIRDIEEVTGLRYAKQELRTIEDLISQADALLDGPDADFYRPFFTAMRALARVVDRTRIER